MSRCFFHQIQFFMMGGVVHHCRVQVDAIVCSVQGTKTYQHTYTYHGNHLLPSWYHGNTLMPSWCHDINQVVAVVTVSRWHYGINLLPSWCHDINLMPSLPWPQLNAKWVPSSCQVYAMVIIFSCFTIALFFLCKRQWNFESGRTGKPKRSSRTGSRS